MMLRVAVLVGVLAGARALLPRAPVRRSRLAALQASRRPFIAGNWKLNPETLQDAEGLLAVLAANQRLLESSGGGSLAEVCVFPPACYLSKALAAVQGTGIQVGSQDVSLEASGAFTGEISAKMLRSVGCSYTLAGHSERRSIYEDTDEIVGKKVVAALAAGLKVILCVGETLREYEMELLESVVTLQVKNGLEHVSPADLRENLVIAYEPVWAIGTGLVATPEQAQHAHEVVRAAVASIDAEAAKTIRIQYGGSVTPETIDGLMEKPDVDGALVGGASLVAEKFSRIIDFKPAAAAVQAPREFLATVAVACKNVLGESLVYAEDDKMLYWISAPEGQVWMWNLVDPPVKHTFAGETIGCVSVCEDGQLLVAMETEIFKYDRIKRVKTKVCDPPQPFSDVRPNDGRVEREGDGALVLGMYNNNHRAGHTAGQDNAGLFRISKDGSVEEILDYQYRVSNVICFSPDGVTMYFCDTPTRKVFAFDYGPTLTNRRLIWTMPAAWEGGPDGAQTDAEGFVWMALSGCGRVARLDPETGEVDMIVRVPVKCPTSVTFGGEDLATLFITTRGPDGGELYSFALPFGIRGLPEPKFAG